MAAATLTPTEDQLFDAVWSFVSTLFDPSFSGQIFKGFQNMTATPYDSYVVISPGVKERFNQVSRDYDATNGLSLNLRATQYKYQVDCYGPDANNNADIISGAWRTMWACDFFAGQGFVIGAPVLPATPLFADEPVQLNLVNGEANYEQRMMCALYLQANQVVGLPQDFFNTVPPVHLIVADQQ